MSTHHIPVKASRDPDFPFFVAYLVTITVMVLALLFTLGLALVNEKRPDSAPAPVLETR